MRDENSSSENFIGDVKCGIDDEDRERGEFFMG
jgi:hypothetical protein